MFVVHDTGIAIFLCVLTMLGWGSWANTQKLAGRVEWPFQLFYWDYSIGVALTGLLAGHLLQHDPAANLHQASTGVFFTAFGAGALFNLANILIVAAIDAAGMSVAFPIGIGLALVIGTAVNYLQMPKGNPVLLTLGVIGIVVAMILSAFAHNRAARSHAHTRRAGLLFALAGGVLMGYFYPRLMKSISPDFVNAPTAAGYFTPYTALAIFGIGVFVSNIPINWVFMLTRKSRFTDYLRAPKHVHWPGILGGAIWMLALMFNVIASGVAGPAISYALGQGATLIAALWGVFIWHEFRGAPAGTKPLVAAMLGAYSIGLILIGRATF